MIIVCPDCNSKYNVPDNKIEGRKKMKCSKCNFVFALDEDFEDSESKKDTAKIMRQNVSDSLWTSENLELPSDIKLSIAIIKGARAGYIYHLSKPYITIGRGKVDLIIPDKEISRKHVALEVRKEKIFLRDLGSTNGTIIDDKKISMTEVTDQTEFKIGQTALMIISTPKYLEK